MYYLYFIRSLKDGFIYIGVTADLAKRLKKHNSGSTTSTKIHRPFEIFYTEEFLSKREALQRELYFKSPKGYLEKLKILKSFGFCRGVEQSGSSSGS